MKKMFTLILALGSIGSVFAQAHQVSRHEARELYLGKEDTHRVEVKNTYSHTYTLSAKDRDRQIKKINKDFDKQIQAVKRNRYLNSFEKKRQVRQLEMQRDQKINEIQNRYSDRHNTYQTHKW